MLKAVAALALVTLVAFVAVPTRADEAADLVVGSVRDTRGAPIAGADVIAFDARGAAAGRDRSDALGTFVVSPLRPARSLEVRCRYCRTARVALPGGNQNVALVVQRFAALESSVPDASDLAALPSGSAIDALGLIPFTLVSGGSISDRGLGGGRGYVLDDGAPMVDLAVGSSATSDFPDRYVRSIDVAGPDRAFRYGIDAGGGTFALDGLDPGRSSAYFDAGRASSLTLEPSFGNVYPAAGVSSDDGASIRRGDLDFSGPFAGGNLRVGYGAGSEDASTGKDDVVRNVSTMRVAYATASRDYRTFADFAASDVGFRDVDLDADYRSAYLSADVRVERPGPVTLSAGANLDRQIGTYSFGGLYPSAYDGRADDETAYVEARAGDDRASFDAGVGVTTVAAVETLLGGSPSGTHAAILPSFSGRVALGGGAYVRAGFSESARLPTLLESADVFPVPSRPPFERGELSEGAVGFDAGGRVRGEAIAYREFTHGFDEARLDGIGASVVWQVAPLVSVRAWSLRASPLAYADTFAVTTESDASRQVVWSTYANGAGLRVDAIVHRDASALVRPQLAFDADVLVPVVSRLAVDVGTAQRSGIRRYSIGLRALR